MNDKISITVSDGKYTIQQTPNGRWEALRYGEEWAAFRDNGPDNLHIALAWELAELKEELACTIEELIDHTGDSMDDSRASRVQKLRFRPHLKTKDV